MRILLSLILIMSMIYLAADFRFGQELFEDGLYEESILEFKEVISDAPTSEDAQRGLLFIAKCHYELLQYTEAENSNKKLIDGYPNNRFLDEAYYQLSKARYAQKKYKQTIKNIDFLLEKYPLSKFTKRSLPVLLRSHFHLTEYDMIIMKGEKFLKDYKNTDEIPEIMLFLAKAYFKSSKTGLGKGLILQIVEQFPNSNARNQALDLEIELLFKGKGELAVIEELTKRLEESVPRNIEKKLRMKLIETYLNTEDYENCYLEINKMIEKFNNSENLDHYLIIKSKCQIELGKFDELLDDESKYEKLFKQSIYLFERKSLSAKALFFLNKFEESEKILKEIISKKNENKIYYEAEFLLAEIYEKREEFNAAIKQYQSLFSVNIFGKELLLKKIADIYFTNFNNYRSAQNIYQQIKNEFPDSDIYPEIFFQNAMCYEKTGKIEEAIAELDLIENSSDSLLHKKIISKRNYLRKFKQKNTETAFNRLINAIYNYLGDDDKEILKQEMISIYANELKELEKSADLIDEKGNPELIYKKAGIYLKLAEKHSLEGKKESSDNHLLKANTLISKLNDNSSRKQIIELKIRKQYILDKHLSQIVVDQMETFIREYPGSEVRNEFLFLVANYYKDQNKPEKSAGLLSQLNFDNSIDQTEYFRAKLDLAEYYFQQNKIEEALENYEIAEPELDITKPVIYYHYARTLAESGQMEIAIEKLVFLVKNNQDFREFDSALLSLTSYLREQNRVNEAIKYSLLFPDQSRDDNFYKILANDYLTVGIKEKAKEHLLKIQDLDDESLTKLAELQYETNDHESAIYSYEQLIDRDKENLDNYRRLAQIYFQQEKFLESAENYKKIVDKLGDDFSSFSNISQLAKENIIALYRINNRPKAETLSKKFKEVLTINDSHEISLNKGIYQIEVDSKKAEKSFSNLLKKKDLEEKTQFSGYFWRGVARLKMEKLDEAESDFKKVADSSDPNLRNQAYFKLGTINFSKENYQEALNFYYRVIENDKKGDLALDAAKNFAFVCKTIEEWQKAVAAYEIILERWGDAGLESKTVFDIAFCHYRDKKYSKAIEMFEKAMEILSDKELLAEAQYWIAESYFGMESYENAVSEFLKVGYSYSEFAHWSASGELRAGEAYINMDKKDKAKRIFERVIEKYGKFSDWGKEARKRLESL